MFLIFFGSFVFHSCLALSRNGIITQYEGVDKDYLKLRFGSQLRDPFLKYKLSQRKELCDQFLNARSYTFVTDESQDPRDLRPLSYQQRFLNIQYKGYAPGHKLTLLEYQAKIIRIDDRIVYMKMFPCTCEGKTEAYLTFGSQHKYAFVITKPRNSADHNLKITALLEPGLILSSPAASKLNSEFWAFNIVSINNLWAASINVPETMELCSATANQHFRLCSAVADEVAARKLESTLLSQENYFWPIEPRCVKHSIKRDELSMPVTANVLPCAINRKWFNGSPDFYLLRNHLVRTLSVWMLTTKEDGYLMVVARLDDSTFV